MFRFRSQSAGRTRYHILTVLIGFAMVLGLIPMSLSTVHAKAPTVLRVALSQKWVTLNPFQGILVADIYLASLNYDLLVEPDANLKPAPGLATSWHHSADGLTWTFTVRKGATWSDGQPVTAKDVAFTYNYILKSETYKGGAYSLGLFTDYFKYVTSIAAPNNTTVVIKSSKPDAAILYNTIPILPEHIWNHVSYEAASGASKHVKAFDNASMVGSGPFHLVKNVPGQYAQFVANKHYWGGAPKIDQLIIQYFPDPGPMVQALRNGQIDLIETVPPAEYGLLKSQKTIAEIRGQPVGFQELGMNSWVPKPGQARANPKQGSAGNPWLTKVAVRQALFHAVNPARLTQIAMLGQAVPGSSIVAPAYPCRWTPTPDQAHTFSPATTKSMLETLGFKDTNGDGYLNVPNTPAAHKFDPKGAGKDFTLRLLLRKAQPQDQTAGQLIQQWYKQAGVRVQSLVVDESPTMADDTFPSATNANNDLYIWGWGGIFSPDPSILMGRIGLTSEINNWQDSNFSNPQFDTLYNKQYTDLNTASRCGVLKQMQQLYYNDGSYSVLWYPYRLQAYRSDRWTGFKLHDGAIMTALAWGQYLPLLSVSPVAASSTSTSSIGVIVGVVVIVLLIILAIIAFLLYRRRMIAAEEAE